MKRLLWLLPLLLLGFVAPANANLVSNPGFETGDFTSWSTHTCNGCQTWGVGNADVHSGSHMAAARCAGTACLDPVTGSFIAQNLSTTAGQHYTVSFWYSSHLGTPTELDVYWNGDLVTQLINKPAGYAEYTFTDLVATGATTPLEFVGRNDPTFAVLDDVDVEAQAAAVPEPSGLAIAGLGLAVVALRRRRKAG